MNANVNERPAQAYPRGETVAVLNRTYSGKLIFEGFAKVCDWEADTNRYWVHFIGLRGRLDEHGPVARFIEDAAQADPEKYVREHQ